MEPIKGSCLCGAVRFELTGKPLSLSYCHCSRCRKQAGLSAAVLMVRRRGEVLYEKALGVQSETTDVVPVAATALDDDPGVRPVLHQISSALPAWHSLPDDGVKRIDGTYGG